MNLTIDEVLSPDKIDNQACLTKASSNSLKYRADVDGLRAVAVLAVLFYHANIGCPGGYVGVDVFFVISGFLITGLILKELDTGNFKLRNFWERRILRILPASAVVTLACLIVGWFILLPLDFRHLGESVIAQAMLAANLYFWRVTGYFTQSEVHPLLHTWSLAVEEQFYLFFPIVMVMLNRFSRRCLLPAIMLLCGLSIFLCIYGSYTHPSVNYYFLPTRAWELGVGSVLAIIPAQRAIKAWLAEILGWGGFLAILYAVLFYNSNTRFPGVSALLPVLGTFFIIFANINSMTSLGKLLALRPIVFIGLISYSLYLWHWPVLAFASYWAIDPIPQTLHILLLLLSVVLAILSWKYIETPFRKRLVLTSRSQIFTFVSVIAVILLVSGITVYKFEGIPSRIPAAALQYANGRMDQKFTNSVSLSEALAGNFLKLGSSDKHQSIDIFLWGDSHANAVLPVLDFMASDYSIRGFAATYYSTCPLVGFESIENVSLQKDSITYNNTVIDFVRRKQIPNLIIVAHWNPYVNYISEDYFYQCLEDTINSLSGTKTKIWIMRTVPGQSYSNPPLALARAVMLHQDPNELGISLDEYRRQTKVIDLIFKKINVKYASVTFLDPTDLLFGSDNICHIEKNGKSRYYDGHHLTITGAMELCPLFKPIFDNIIENKN